MSRETDSQERQTVRALLPTVSPTTDKRLREIHGDLRILGVFIVLVGGWAATKLYTIAVHMERLIEAQAP